MSELFPNLSYIYWGQGSQCRRAGWGKPEQILLAANCREGRRTLPYNDKPAGQVDRIVSDRFWKSDCQKKPPWKATLIPARLTILLSARALMAVA